MASRIVVDKVDAGYGAVRVLHNVSLNVEAGETVVLLGTNGNGKSTLMKCIMGIVRPSSGRIMAAIDGVQHDLTSLTTEQIVDLGIALVPEGRRLFPRQTVEENLLLGAYRRTARAQIKANLDFCFETFPRLAERRNQLAGSMSGGEQQMLALGRALMLAPKILLVDEPSVGLAPILVARTIDKIKELKERYDLTVLMAEQNFTQALRIADRGYVIVHGQIEFEGNSAEELNNNDLIRKFYLGLEDAKESQSERGKSEESDSTKSEAVAREEPWYETLGISPTATAHEINAAWREKLKKTHPDRVADLDTAFQTLADERTKKLNAARDEGLRVQGKT